MFRATNSPILRSTFWLYVQLLVQYDAPILLPTGRQQYRCSIPKTVCTVKKCSWGWTSLSPETCTADLKRSINGICCILLVVYVVVLMMHGLTNIKKFLARYKTLCFVPVWVSWAEWIHQVLQRHWYPPTTLRGVITQKASLNLHRDGNRKYDTVSR